MQLRRMNAILVVALLAVVEAASFCTMDSYCGAAVVSDETYPSLIRPDLTLSSLIVIVRHGDRTPYQ